MFLILCIGDPNNTCRIVSFSLIVCVSAEEYVHVCVRLLRQHRRLPVHPHHPPVQSHHRQEEHPRSRQVSEPLIDRFISTAEKRTLYSRCWRKSCKKGKKSSLLHDSSVFLKFCNYCESVSAPHFSPSSCEIYLFKSHLDVSQSGGAALEILQRWCRGTFIKSVRLFWKRKIKSSRKDSVYIVLLMCSFTG